MGIRGLSWPDCETGGFPQAPLRDTQALVPSLVRFPGVAWPAEQADIRRIKRPRCRPPAPRDRSHACCGPGLLAPFELEPGDQETPGPAIVDRADRLWALAGWS